MAARTALPGEILIDELAIARRPEAREMPAMDDGDGNPRMRSSVVHIVVDVGMISIVDQRAVIDDVARQEDAGLASRTGAMPPGEWPGVWMTSKARSPRSMTSPDSSRRSAGAGAMR